MLLKFKKVYSPLCYLCGKELETLEHLFFCSPRVHAFWDEVTVMLHSQGITMVAHCSHREKQSKCYNKVKILEIMSKLNENKI